MESLKTFAKLSHFANPGISVYFLTSIACVLALYYIVKRQRKVWLINQIPGPVALPIFGNALELNVGPREIFIRVVGYTKIWGRDQPIFKAWLGTTPFVFLNKPESVEVILGSQKHIDKGNVYNYLRPWLGDGLLTSTGKKWHNRRKLLTPAFHFKILEEFMEVFNQQSSIFVRKLKTKVNGESFDIFPLITLCTLDIILETAMGRNINAQDNMDSDYVKAIYKIGSIVQLRQSRPWLQPNIFFRFSSYSKEHKECLKILHGFANETIKERKKERQEFKKLKELAHGSEVAGKRKRLAFLDLILEYSEGNDSITDEDIREEVDTFMFEGHDTTAAAINWTIYLLGSHPKIQEKVHEELDMIFGEDDRDATINDLREMKLLECCIKEALRLFPSVPFIARELKEDLVLDGYKVPAGTNLLITSYRAHRDPEHFPEPEVFKPERFLPENSAKRHPYAYIPFSAGPRNCIGQKFAMMEEKVVLSSFFRKYRVESKTRREDLKILGELILRPEDGNLVNLFERKK